MKTIDKSTLAINLLDFNSSIASGQKFSRETLHLFCSPLFLEAMYALFDKNIQTVSCGSGKERNILPGITGNYETLTIENKEVVKELMISPTEFRIGAEISDTTTFFEFESKLLEIINKLNQQ